MLIKAFQCFRCLWVFGLLTIGGAVLADQFLVNVGSSPQPGSDQINRTAGVDYTFYRHDRSLRSSFHIGMSYTYMSTDTADFNTMHAFSIFPQLSLYPTPDSWARSLLPGGAEPFFYVRALGPSYISANRLGDRQQAHNFAFQAQIGVGAIIRRRNNSDVIIAVSWKHFSNANLFNDNDGIDLPIVLNFGFSF